MEPKKMKIIKRFDRAQKFMVKDLYRVWIQTLYYPIVLEAEHTDEMGYKMELWAHPNDVAILRQLAGLMGMRCAVHTYRGIKEDRISVTLF